jgi:competence protein ComEA
VIRPVLLDPNRATIAELQALPGIGPARARAIVLHRVRHGWFRDLDALAAVDGIGPVTLAGLRPYLAPPAAPAAPAAADAGPESGHGG